MRSFTLSDDIIVKGADLKDGLLVIDLEKVIPEKEATADSNWFLIMMRGPWLGGERRRAFIGDNMAEETFKVDTEEEVEDKTVKVEQDFDSPEEDDGM